jgi:hemerythrin
MLTMTKIPVATGIYWVEIPQAGLRLLCGCPADAVKHLARRGLIVSKEHEGRVYETGPNAILLSDVPVQNGQLSNLAEFPVLQMLYRQGTLLPGHPNNTGDRPILIGSTRQVKAQMRYIYRGNYGLVNEEELSACGMPPEDVRNNLALKSHFAYGHILQTDELVERVIVGAQPTRIKKGVTVRRLRQNVFELLYRGQSVTVDLNLEPQQSYQSPYPLGFHQIGREYFSVVHSGDGNGWDTDRPCMSSILIFQGRIYLIDAGPNLDHLLRALGIGLNEIEGVFHTHAHDDHFCGLTTLVRSDHRIKYFATPCVRASVTKKLSALLSIHEEELPHLLDFRDLRLHRWNEVDGLEVRPIFSPHSVETTIFQFRTPCAEGYSTYAHYADLVNLETLKQFVGAPGKPGTIPQRLYDRVRREYLAAVNLKKVDVGGGWIHGNAEDFRRDRSQKILLSHFAGEPTDRQKEIGSSASFGSVDVLIPARLDYLRTRAAEYLRSYYPGVPANQVEGLINCDIVHFNPETVLMRPRETPESVYLLLSGEVEAIRTQPELRRVLSTGTLVGDDHVLQSSPVTETYRTVSFVRMLQIPRRVYSEFVQRNGLGEAISGLRERRDFLQSTWLFGERIPYPVRNNIARQMQASTIAAGSSFQPDAAPGICLIRRGKLQLLLDSDVVETLTAGDFYGASSVLHDTPGLFRLHALDETDVYRVPGELLLTIPVVRWKLFETYERRMRKALNPDAVSELDVRWREQYRTGVEALDRDHEAFLNEAAVVCENLTADDDRKMQRQVLTFLEDYAKRHFAREEMLLQTHGYPDLARHRREHQAFREEVADFRRRLETHSSGLAADFVEFLRDWIVDHLLTEDQNYSAFFRDRGVT